MRRMIARWMIGRSIDEGRQAPRWVRRLVERDAALADYERRARLLADRLAGDAAAWADAADDRGASGSGGHRAVVGYVGPSRTMRVVFRIAAAVALAGIVWVVIPKEAGEIDPGNPPGGVVVSGDPEASGADADQLRAMIADGLEAARKWRDETRDEIANAAIGTVRDMIERPVDSAARATGQTLAMLTTGVTRESAALRRDTRESIDYLSRRFSEGFAAWRGAVQR